MYFITQIAYWKNNFCLSKNYVMNEIEFTLIKIVFLLIYYNLNFNY